MYFMKKPAWQLPERLSIMVFVAVTQARLKCIFNNRIIPGRILYFMYIVN